MSNNNLQDAQDFAFFLQQMAGFRNLQYDYTRMKRHLFRNWQRIVGDVMRLWG
jgi:hypothetical protein